MDQSHRGWPPPPQQAGGGGAHEQQGQSQQPSRPGFAAGPGQQSPPQGSSSLPPSHSGPFPHFHHQQAPSLASLAGISQSSPSQPPRPDRRPEHSQLSPPQGPQLPLPGFSQAIGQPGAADREQRAREVEQIHIKEEEDRRHREQERQRLEQATPHQSQSGPPIHLHQPVAVGPRSVHGPNGLLGTPNMPAPQPQQSMPLGGPGGPSNVFSGGPVQPPSQSSGPTGQQIQQAGMLVPFAHSGQPPSSQQNMGQQGQQGQGQGQQPILNDALSYLDQVKVQFADHPDVYNRFLDIMKDFKSGAIDTPGVIGRVSTLFAGNPDLIQGFNTFLPPGYRIECGADNDPNSIRVTTPMGTTVSAMPQARPLSRQEGGESSSRPANGTYTPQPGQSAQMMFSPGGRPLGPNAPGQQQQQQQQQQPPQQQSQQSHQTAHLSPMETARQQEQQAIHQQEQRGVNSLQSAVSAAAASNNARPGVSPRGTPVPGQRDAAGQPADAQQDQAGAEKRGPVEFNHAISYVNKIKNRFAAHPDIYKQFLEILQTYQRESKPIQDVYGQVTRLFNTAPDLLEDFKQFLPESAAHAKAAERARQHAEANAMTSNVREEGRYGSPVMSREAQMGTPSHSRGNLPPVGNFAPTPVGKDNKRKRQDRQDRQGTVGSAAEGGPGPSTSKTSGYNAQQSKKMKPTHPISSKGQPDHAPHSPSLIPTLPSPLAPTTSSAATHDELAFFERARKAIGNKNTMNEFLKLCNLFSQDLIDRTLLVHRARAFLGVNPELMKFFMDFVGYDEKDVVIENRAREPIVPSSRISLSNCRGFGPSYRLLPKRERMKTCSGRDELCNSVLNDEWASHPTWASEDSGFIAHRKNVHEEGLHRIEEERHDYDYNVEACSRTIQLLEPLAQQLRRMSTAEQDSFQLPPGLGGQSETIYKRVIMKLYGRDKGRDTIVQLHNAPASVIPVLLNRLQERLETWKMAQREWEKVWREQTQRMFWRSLDHQAVSAKSADRRQFQTKTLQAEIQIKYEEMKSQEQKSRGSMRGKPQIEAQVGDLGVVVDATWLLLEYANQQGSTDSPRLAPFVRDFIPIFFGIDVTEFENALKRRKGETPIDGEPADMDLSGAEDTGEKRGRKSVKNSSLWRQTIDKKGGRGKKDRDDSASRASTPDGASNAGDEAEPMSVDPVGTPNPETESIEQKPSTTNGDTASVRWLEHPTTENSLRHRNVDPDQMQKRQTYRMWANTPIYCFMRMFLILYERLAKLKDSEENCKATVRFAAAPKPAHELGIMDKMPQDFFTEVGPNVSYYEQMLTKFTAVLYGDIDFSPDVEECLRRFYLRAGYPLYHFEKMIQALARYGGMVVSQDGANNNKEKSWEIIQLFKKDRAKIGELVTPAQATDYRKGVERLIGGGEGYEIDWDSNNQSVKIFLAKKDDPYYSPDGISPLDEENRWRYYIASYSTLASTDGIDRGQIRPVILQRNISGQAGSDRPRALALAQRETEQPDPTDSASDSDGTGLQVGSRLLSRFLAASNTEQLVMRIDVNTYRRVFTPQTAEGFIETPLERSGGDEGVRDAERVARHREEKVWEGFVAVNEGMKGLGRGEVEEANQAWTKIVEGEAKKETEDGMEVDG